MNQDVLRTMRHSLFIFTLLILLYSCKDRRASSNNCAVDPKKEVILDQLKHPWGIAFIDEDDVLITEKDGHLIRADLSTGEKRTVKAFPQDLVDSVRSEDIRDNSGIFDVVLHPDFKKNHWVYISYSSENHQGTTTKVIRARLQDDTLIDEHVIFVAEPYRRELFHYGGGMTFGSDGKLYFTIGERFYNELDQPDLPVAQDLTDKRGKIYRLNDDGTIPDDNPNFESESIPGIYALGIRAAQGITLDEESGEIWFSEHGTFQGDELNILAKGANFGWPIETTGKYRSPQYQPPILEDREFTPPVHYWLQTIAPAGLHFYYGSEFSCWNGNIILSGLSRGSLWRINLTEGKPSSIEELFINDRVRSRNVAQSPQGKLYMLTDEINGKLIRIYNDL